MSNNHGFALTETLVATAIASLAIATFLNLFSDLIRNHAKISQHLLLEREQLNLEANLRAGVPIEEIERTYNRWTIQPLQIHPFLPLNSQYFKAWVVNHKDTNLSFEVISHAS